MAEVSRSEQGQKLPLKGNQWEFSKIGTGLFSPDFLSYGQENRDLSRANKAIQFLVQEIGGFMKDGWRFTSIISMQYCYANRTNIGKKTINLGDGREVRGEEIAIVFTNPLLTKVVSSPGMDPNFIKPEMRKEVRHDHFYGWCLDERPYEKLFAEAGFSLVDGFDLRITHNELPRQTHFWQKKHKRFQEGVAIVIGNLRQIK